MSFVNVPQGPVADNEMKLKKKHRIKKPGNVGTNKRKNSGGAGKKAKSTKRARTVNSRTSPEQYGRWKAWMDSVGWPVYG